MHAVRRRFSIFGRLHGFRILHSFIILVSHVLARLSSVTVPYTVFLVAAFGVYGAVVCRSGWND
jgi:hypothetical protein